MELWITATPDDDAPLGAPRIGGAPDLPRGTAWPRRRWSRAEVATWPDFARAEVDAAIAAGTVIVEDDQVALALPFVAQLELAALGLEPGRIWLFADQTTHEGMRDDYPHVACVCLASDTSDLVRTTPPPTPEAFAPATLGFAPAPDDDQPEPRHAALARPCDGTTQVPPPGYTTLLRVDTDDRLGTHWGDAAWIDFAIADDDLAARRFDAILAFRFIG